MRTAFQAWLAHEHRSPTSRVSAVAVGSGGSTLYVGLSDGQLEEYKVNSDSQRVWLSLEARKTVGKQVKGAQSSSLCCTTGAPLDTPTISLTSCSIQGKEGTALSAGALAALNPVQPSLCCCRAPAKAPCTSKASCVPFRSDLILTGCVWLICSP